MYRATMHRGQPSLATLLVLSVVVLVPHKTCASCGRHYTRKGWEALAYVGTLVDDVEALEMRNCSEPCGSTITVCTARFPANDVAERVPPTLRSAR